MDCGNADFPLAICHWDLAFCGGYAPTAQLAGLVDTWPVSWQHQLTPVVLFVTSAAALRCWEQAETWYLVPRCLPAPVPRCSLLALRTVISFALVTHRWRILYVTAVPPGADSARPFVLAINWRLRCWKARLTIRRDDLTSIGPFKRIPCAPTQELCFHIFEYCYLNRWGRLILQLIVSTFCWKCLRQQTKPSGVINEIHCGINFHL